jgi:AAA15 family ATPase/GTPase
LSLQQVLSITYLALPDLIPALHKILREPSTIVIDEIEQSIHVCLLKELVTKIMADTDTKGQLIFTTHESALLDLDLLRQDEIWFAEKDKSGATRLYSLSEFKPRYDKDIRKGYLQGRFGAVPLKELIK